MKKFFPVLILIPLLFCLLYGCKSAKKSLKRGDFDDSVLRAVEKLKDNPDHTSSIEILKQAYPAALEQHLQELKQIQLSADLFKSEPELISYENLNKLYKAISQCNVCAKAVDARNFENEEYTARNNAVNIRYKEGERSLSNGDRESARKAYEHFEKVNLLIPDFKEVRKKWIWLMKLRRLKSS